MTDGSCRPSGSTSRPRCSRRCYYIRRTGRRHRPDARPRSRSSSRTPRSRDWRHRRRCRSARARCSRSRTRRRIPCPLRRLPHCRYSPPRHTRNPPNTRSSACRSLSKHDAVAFFPASGRRSGSGPATSCSPLGEAPPRSRCRERHFSSKCALRAAATSCRKRQLLALARFAHRAHVRASATAAEISAARFRRGRRIRRPCGRPSSARWRPRGLGPP